MNLDRDIGRVTDPDSSLDNSRLDLSGQNPELGITSSEAILLAYNKPTIDLFSKVRRGFARISELTGNLGKEIKSKKLQIAGGLLVTAALAAAGCGGKAQDQEGGSGVRIETQSLAATATPEPTTITIYGVELDRKELQAKWQWDQRGPKTEDIGKHPLPADVKAFLDSLLKKNLTRREFISPETSPLTFAYLEASDPKLRFAAYGSIYSNIGGVCLSRPPGSEFQECVRLAETWRGFVQRDYPEQFSSEAESIWRLPSR